MVGIDVLKNDIVLIAKLVKKVDLALEDDKVSFTESIALAFEIPNLFKVVKGYKEAVAELKDLDTNEVNELNTHFATEFDITNDKAEEVVEQILSLIVTLASTFLLTKEV